MTEAVAVDAEEARCLRHAMTDELVKLERITSCPLLPRAPELKPSVN